MTAQRLIGLAAVLLGSALIPAAAASELTDPSLTGATLSWQFYANGGPFTMDDSVTGGEFVVDGGVGGTLNFGSLVILNIEADYGSITFDYSPYNGSVSPDFWSQPADGVGLALAPTIYTGIAIDLLSDGSFNTVTIDPSTNMTGFDYSDLSFSGDQIQVNFAGLPFSTSTVVTLDVNTPEPGTFSVIILASVLIGLVFRRKLMRSGSLV